jgi:hypothetical protein
MTPGLISLMVPTRSRPSNVARLLGSLLETAMRPDLVEVLFYVDDDDPCLDIIQEVAERSAWQPLAVKTYVGPRIVLSECPNVLWRQLARGEILAFLGDDYIFRSDWWDGMVRQAFTSCPDKILFVHGRDGIHPDGSFGTYGFIHQRWAQTLGGVLPGHFGADWADTWMNEVANTISRRLYLSNIYLEHMHPIAGKGPLDRTHAERLARAAPATERYAETKADRVRDAETLRNLLGKP